VVVGEFRQKNVIFVEFKFTPAKLTKLATVNTVITATIVTTLTNVVIVATVTTITTTTTPFDKGTKENMDLHAA